MKAAVNSRRLENQNTSLMRTRVLNYFTNATQSSRERNASLVHMKLCESVWRRKWADGA